jgi:RNA polymerase sigma-70 factor (ECF subfamily)
LGARRESRTAGAAVELPLSQASDEVLFAGLRAGSEPHFNAFYERYFARVYGFVRARVRDRSDAEELTQEAFTIVFRGSEAYSGRSTPLAWVYGVAKNTVRSYLRRQRVAREQLAELDEHACRSHSPIWSLNPEDQLSLDRFAREMAERLGQLEEWQCEAFAMRHFENISIPEIARRMARSSDAVRSGLYRAKRLLLDTAPGSRVPGPGARA